MVLILRKNGKMFVQSYQALLGKQLSQVSFPLKRVLCQTLYLTPSDKFHLILACHDFVKLFGCGLVACRFRGSGKLQQSSTPLTPRCIAKRGNEMFKLKTQIALRKMNYFQKHLFQPVTQDRGLELRIMKFKKRQNLVHCPFKEN